MGLGQESKMQNYSKTIRINIYHIFFPQGTQNYSYTMLYDYTYTTGVVGIVTAHDRETDQQLLEWDVIVYFCT